MHTHMKTLKRLKGIHVCISFNYLPWLMLHSIFHIHVNFAHVKPECHWCVKCARPVD